VAVKKNVLAMAKEKRSIDLVLATTKVISKEEGYPVPKATVEGLLGWATGAAFEILSAWRRIVELHRVWL
jgi:hypothetical protein